jgi:hypothetical protein
MEARVIVADDLVCWDHYNQEVKRTKENLT